MATKYWTSTQWVLQDGAVTTPPGQGDVGVLGGPSPSGLPPLPQSGTVAFQGLQTSDIGTLEVDGAGPWSIVGTGGTDSTIQNLIVAMGTTVTVASGGTIAVENVVIQQASGITTPATVTLGDGLAPGDGIDFQNQQGLTYTSAFNGTYTSITVLSGSTVVGDISLIGNVQLAPATSDGAGGTEIVVQGTQPVIGTATGNSPYSILAVADAPNGNIPAYQEWIFFGNLDVQPNGYQNTTISAASITNPSTGQPYSVLSVPFLPQPAVPNFFERLLEYDPNDPADNYMIQPWTLTVTNGTSLPETTTTPSLAGVTPPPFAANVTMSVSAPGQNPTFNWTYPAGSSINGLIFAIYDGNTNKLLYQTGLSTSTTQFTVPTQLDGGLTLQQDQPYKVSLVAETSRDPTQPISYANTAAEAYSYASFEITGGTVPTVYLPTVTSTGAYQFNLQVITGQSYSVDPSIATGYTYATGAGNPNFASVLLPSIQTTPYKISFLNNGTQEIDTVAPNTVFAFPTGGVSTFTVTGINVADDLNPTDTTAFVTGLTFVSSGNFTGTMTPITTLDHGPTAGSTSITVGHNQVLNETALVDSLVTPGLAGDTETVISVTGNATLSGSTITYNSPASGTDSFGYTVQDELGDTATGKVNVTVDPGPTITSVAPSAVEAGQTTEIGTVAPGLAGDSLTLKQTGGTGEVSWQLVNGTMELFYTAPSTVSATMEDTASFTIIDQYNDVVASGPVIVQLDAGPTVTSVTSSLIDAGQKEEIGTVTPGVAGDTLTLKQTGGNGSLALQLVNGIEELIYTAPANVTAGMLDNVTYTITDQHDDAVATGSNTIPVAPANDATYIGTAGRILIVGDRNSAVAGTAGNETLLIGNGNDFIVGGPDDVIVAGNGNDFIVGGSNNYILVGNGKDTVSGASSSWIIAGNGDDTVNVGNHDSIILGNGTDAVSAGAGSTIVAGNGNDTVSAGPNSTISLGNGGDMVYAGANDLITLGKGTDNIAFAQSPNPIEIGNDTIYGFNAAHDVLQFNPALLPNYAIALMDTKQVGANTVIKIDPTDLLTLENVLASSLSTKNFHF